ncbi:Actin patches distal protein 1 [Escovopsis weberi]|uniref:Actin patches distal protein 1 n=1 Tax=Escovopsis weberi TaxID=150374 RepID=A0A0M9VUK9_ESCWE|nr:Actin patches distal protein 1 [Escovopsis weberi]
MATLFPQTDPATDGPECLRDCESCTLAYPRGFKIDDDDALYGHVKGWSTHLVVGTGKTDWVRDVADETGSVMEAIKRADAPSNGRLMLSASNMPTAGDGASYADDTTALLLPAFVLVRNLRPANVPQLLRSVVSAAPTTASPLAPWAPPLLLGADATGSASSSPDALPSLCVEACPHSAVILMCSQRTRDARCGQSAPLLRRELERHLRALGLHRDLDDARPGGVGVYFVSHVGGHKYSANVLVYRRPNAFGLDDEPLPGGVAEAEPRGEEKKEEEEKEEKKEEEEKEEKEEEKEEEEEEEEEEARDGEAKADVGAAQCIWLARVRPADCENLVRYTVLRGKVVKPESQLRGGFDRSRGLLSW